MVNTAGRTLVQAVNCENPACRQVIMRVWNFQGRRQCENVSCSCDNALTDALQLVLSRRRARTTAKAEPPDRPASE